MVTPPHCCCHTMLTFPKLCFLRPTVPCSKKADNDTAHHITDQVVTKFTVKQCSAFALGQCIYCGSLVLVCVVGGISTENNTAFPFPRVLTDDIPYTICSVVAG